jgi:hypothetical protein
MLGCSQNFHKSCITVPTENCNPKSRLLNNILLTLKKVQMKNLRKIALCVSITLYSLNATAQTGTGIVPVNEPNLNKPELFRDLPTNIAIDGTILTNLIGSSAGAVINLNLSPASGFTFRGEVISSVSKYDNKIQSIVIRSSNYAGARLTLSKITDDNGNVKFTGRIVSMQHADLYDVKLIDNQFFLVKRKFYDLINE